jgi:hypothetical protein|tara:strand:+ start:806 stop:1054 length:249 start_codon:yes stop_codon:yes gene_type:complete
MTKKDKDWQILPILKTRFSSSTSGIWVKDKFITNDQLAQIVKLQSKGVSARNTSLETGVSVGRVMDIFSYIKDILTSIYKKK